MPHLILYKPEFISSNGNGYIDSKLLLYHVVESQLKYYLMYIFCSKDDETRCHARGVTTSAIAPELTGGERRRLTIE
jgi:hypothetical protein